MKILQVVPYFYPAWAYGGPAKLVYDTSKFFAESGHQVTVYTSDSYDEKQRMPKSKYVDISNLTVRYFKNFHNRLTYVYNIFITPGLFIPAIFELPQFDVIHLHDFYTIENVWLGLLARLYKVPYILSVHGCLEDTRLKTRSLFKQSFLNLFGKSLLANASALIATSPNEVKAYQSFNITKSKIYLLGHGVDSKEFQTQLSKIKSRQNFKISSNAVVVTFLGRIHKIKGLDKLVEAIALIDRPQVQYVIAGSNDGYLPELKLLIKKNNLQQKIKLIGTCYGEEKAQLFKASDIFVYPSYSEGFSLGLLEAGAAGLPLVITAGCHFDEVKKYQAGEIVESDGTKLAAALTKLIDQPKLRQVASQNVLKLISDNYSIEAIGNKFLKIYQKYD